MRPITMYLGMLLVGTGCGPDFAGDRNAASFSSTLSRQTVRWTPETPVALGERFRFSDATICVFGCVGVDAGAWLGDPGVLAGDPFVELTAVGEGTRLISTGPLIDTFSVTVKAPTSLRVTDPLALSRQDWTRLVSFGDAGVPIVPDVGEEIVLGPDASVFLEVVLEDDAGHWLGSTAPFHLTATSQGLTVELSNRDGRLIDVHGGAIGASAVTTVTRGDGGLARDYAWRVAGPEEIASIELISGSFDPNEVVRAVVRRADGGLMLGAPLEWSLEGLAEIDYAASTSLRKRSDVMLVQGRGDAGTRRQVTVRGGGAVATLFVDVPDPEELVDAGTGTGPPRATSGCSCNSVELAPVLFAALALSRRRRSRLLLG